MKEQLTKLQNNVFDALKTKTEVFMCGNNLIGKSYFSALYAVIICEDKEARVLINIELKKYVLKILKNNYIGMKQLLIQFFLNILGLLFILGIIIIVLMTLIIIDLQHLC
jgi:hypothetical protein